MKTLRFMAMLVLFTLTVQFTALGDETTYYVNKDGGKKYHTDEHCVSINPKYHDSVVALTAEEMKQAPNTSYRRCTICVNDDYVLNDNGLFAWLVERSYTYQFFADGHILFALYDWDVAPTDDASNRAVESLVCLSENGTQQWQYVFPYKVYCDRITMALMHDGTCAILTPTEDSHAFHLTVLSKLGECLTDKQLTLACERAIVMPNGIYYDVRDVIGNNCVELALMDWEGHVASQLLEGYKTFAIDSVRQGDTYTVLSGNAFDIEGVLHNIMVALDKQGILQNIYDLGRCFDQWPGSWMIAESGEIVVVVQSTQDNVNKFDLRSINTAGEEMWRTEFAYGDYQIGVDVIKQADNGDYHLWGRLSALSDAEVQELLFELVLDKDRQFVSNTFKPFLGYVQEYVNGNVYAVLREWSYYVSRFTPFDQLPGMEMADFEIKH